MAVRGSYGLFWVTLVLLALAGVLDMHRLPPELARFFLEQPPVLAAAWLSYIIGYIGSAIFLWTGRPSRALILYVLSFAADIILWTFVITLGVNSASMPLWASILDGLVTLTDLIAICYMAFIVIALRKTDAFRWT